ncbi:hypothetical protein [Nocardioides solisilvae]|uniref:hypothetical protein n=1 Tax=Nocardioides solisilvae TaxID=1542435 RepID=UPI0013A548A7|nr:hypothetical protein [Nocardioides solisilvae]
MITNTITKTASTPSFGMPVHTSAGAHAAACGAGVVIRDRHLGVWVKDVVVADAVRRALPGTTAWRPPTS